MKITKVHALGLSAFPGRCARELSRNPKSETASWCSYRLIPTKESPVGGEVTTYPGPIANRAVAAMIGEVNDFLVGEKH